MAGTGGKRKGAGRKSKVEEQKVNTLFVKALKKLYKQDDSDEAKIAFIEDLAESQRGQIFIAEHVFGKPKEIVENINHNYNQELTKEEAEAVAKAFLDKY